MEAPEFSTSSTSRLKREDLKRTKHDSEFHKWKILIGPSDWEDHLSGKEGTERYRTHNLPVCTSCTGTYELGIAGSHTDDGRKDHKLDPDQIVVVYVGEADNVRTRLQEYGRDGSHLDHGSCSYENGSSCVPKGPGFFKEIFSKGYPIVFRWAPMDSKRDAKEKETQLLREFDYAWNKGKNGNQRPDDILVKLDKLSSRTNPLGKKQVGNKGKKLPAEETEPYNCNTNIDDFHSRIIKIGRSQPRLVPSISVSNNDPTTICGVILADGSICRRLPNEGRKRCEEHKGKKINGVTPKLETQGIPLICSPNEEKSTICGVILDDGSICRRLPNEGRKRCEEHKGKKINGVTPKLETREIPIICSPNEEKPTICGVILGDGSFCREIPVNGRKRCEVHKGMRATTTSPPSISKTNFGRVSDRFEVYEDNTTICGMILGNGSVCRRIPNEGRKRCEEHKGKRINGFTPKFEIQSESVVCGAGLQNGSVCRRAPAFGRQRCEMHKGRRAAY